MDLIVEDCLRERWQLGSAEEEKGESPESGWNSYLRVHRAIEIDGRFPF